jgi:HD-like signal output (HDOD) protein
MTAIESQFQQILCRLERLRSSASVAQRVLQIIDNPDFDTQEVVALLESDPAMAAQILKLVNSAYFGLPRQVASLRQAVLCLGTHTLRLVLLNFGVLQGMAKGLTPQQREQFLRHSLTTALLAQKFQVLRGSDDGDAAYCAGLMADVGILALLQVEPKRYRPLLTSQHFNADLCDAEEEAFGFNHAQLGARLLQHWNLPEAIVSAVEQHHQSVRASADELTSSVQIATLMAEVLWVPNCMRVTGARELLGEHFALTLDDMIQLAVDCKAWLQSHGETFNLHLHDEIDVDELREQAMERFVAESVATAVELDGLTSLLDTPLPSLPN